MKRNAYTIAAVAALVLFAIVPTYAQQVSVKVNVPFSFYVDEVKMPAGEYLIHSPSEKVITIQRIGGSEAETILINNSERGNWNGQPKLVLHRYGTMYFVAQAWLPNADHGHELFASAREIETARYAHQETVELAMARVK